MSNKICGFANFVAIRLTNFYSEQRRLNRIIGDAALPPEQRLTKTNIRKLTKDTKLMESGPLEPVQILETLAP